MRHTPHDEQNEQKQTYHTSDFVENTPFIYDSGGIQRIGNKLVLVRM